MCGVKSFYLRSKGFRLYASCYHVCLTLNNNKYIVRSRRRTAQTVRPRPKTNSLHRSSSQTTSRFEDLRKLVRYFAHNLLVAGAALRLLAEDAGEDLHQVLLAVLVLGIVGVAQDLPAQLQVPFANLGIG